MSVPDGRLIKPLGPLTRRPGVVTGLLLAAGILLHDAITVNQIKLLIVSWTIALLAGLLLHRRVSGALCLSALILFIAIALARREHFQFSKADIGLFAADEPRLAELQVQLLDDPEIVTGPAMGQRMLPPKQMVSAQVRQIHTWQGWIRATGQLPMVIDQICPALQAGQTVGLLGMLQRPRPAMNPGEFDWAWYYRQQRILATFTVTRVDNIHILSNPGPSPIGWLRTKARQCLAAGFKQSDAANSALLDALLLGHRDPELRDVQDEFKQTGMGYQLSVSGMHIALLALVVFYICRWCCLQPQFTLWITTGFVLLYAGVSLPSHSGIRGAILCLVIAGASATGRLTDTRQRLSLAVMAMLLWHPIDLYSVGFQLSFAVCIAFVFLPQALQQWVQRFGDPHEIARPDDGQRSWILQLRGWIWFCLQYGLIAWLATLPLVAYHFGQASSWAIFGSLLVFPFIALALIGGMFKVLLTLLWPRLAWVFARVTGWPVQVVHWGVHEMTRLPGSPMVVPSPPLWLIVMYYLLLIAPLLPYQGWLTGPRRWLIRPAPVVGVVAILFWSHCRWSAPTPADELKLTLLSVGAGQCAVVEPPGGLPILFDAGSTTITDVADKVVEPFLRSEGQSRIDEIFLSHGDFDHISAASQLAANDQARETFTSWHFIKNSAGNLPDQMLLDDLGKLNRTPLQISLGDHLDLGHGTALEVLWPPKTGELNSNNAGLVLRVTYAGRSILFPADIQDPAFTGVLKNPSALRSDILIAPHHGSSEDLTPSFIAAVQPQMILSSNFGRLTNKQKRFDAMAGKIPLYRTSDYGALCITIGRNGTITLIPFHQKSR